MIHVDPQVYVRVPSFDVGLKNMSFCVLDFFQHDFDIKKWTNISLRGKNISDYTRETIEKLREYNFGCLDYVLIEQQINRNTQMKVISHVIQSYFLCDLKVPCNRVIFVSPKKRLDCSSDVHGAIIRRVKEEMGIASEDGYTRKQYKMVSIEIAKYYLNSKENWASFFNALQKKDDFADSFVQAIAWNYCTSIMDVD